ncbi:MAG: carboxypeptidase regulatory-like domain-containing protein, partial [Planctomycetes bacterium]|nr:carboxypeptidase regulatory-like domain-containing protein [Planctomycetota bacterium]
MGRRILIPALAILGLLLFVVSVGVYQGWFGGATDDVSSVPSTGRIDSRLADGTSDDEGSDRTDDSATSAEFDGSTVADAAPDENSSEDRAGDTGVDDGSDGWGEDESAIYAIEGYVTTVDGAPLAGVRVEALEHESALFSNHAIRFLRTLGDPDAPVATGATDDFGTFRLTLPGPGRYYLKASASGYSAGLEGPIRLHRGDPVAALVIPLPVGYSIEGIVLDEARRPQAGIPLVLMRKGDLGYALGKH